MNKPRKSRATRPPRTLADRFWAKVRRGAPDECWEWTGTRLRTGYGMMSDGVHRNPQTTHRVSYFLHYGPIMDGMYVLHSCDNPSCVNPAHLRAGSHADNMRDMCERHRHGQSQKTQCVRGHEFTGDNLRVRVRKSGLFVRICVACVRDRNRALADRRRNGACA